MVSGHDSQPLVVSIPLAIPNVSDGAFHLARCCSHRTLQAELETGVVLGTMPTGD